MKLNRNLLKVISYLKYLNIVYGIIIRHSNDKSPFPIKVPPNTSPFSFRIKYSKPHTIKFKYSNTSKYERINLTSETLRYNMHIIKIGTLGKKYVIPK